MSRVVITDEFIKSLTNSNNQVALQSNAQGYLIDWNNNKFNSMNFSLLEGNFDILEINSCADQKVTYSLGENVYLKITFSTLLKSEDSKYDFILAKDSEVNAAYADFDKGEKHVYMMFELNGENSKVNWHLASLSAGNDKKEFEVSFNHRASNTTAIMNNYGVAENEAHLTFSGVGHIFNKAKKAKTHQNAKIMVFDKGCVAKASPILKIDENDVEASHAASVGTVNDEHLFYLCSRGITEDEAKKLITLGYLNPILKHFKDEDVSSQIANAIQGRV